jgi:hypothetical protein
LKNSYVNDFQDAYKTFQDSGFRLRALLRSMVLSESFYDAPPAAPDTNTSKEVGAQ